MNHRLHIDIKSSKKRMAEMADTSTEQDLSEQHSTIIESKTYAVKLPEHVPQMSEIQTEPVSQMSEIQTELVPQMTEIQAQAELVPQTTEIQTEQVPQTTEIKTEEVPQMPEIKTELVSQMPEIPTEEVPRMPEMKVDMKLVDQVCLLQELLGRSERRLDSLEETVSQITAKAELVRQARQSRAGKLADIQQRIVSLRTVTRQQDLAIC